MKRTMFKVFGLLTLAVSLTAGWLWWDYKVFLDTPLTLPAGGHRVVVEKGSNLTRLTQELKEQQILTHPAYLLWYARWNGLSNIKVGEYALESGTNPRLLLEQLTSGRVIQYAQTIVEGWTFAQLFDAIGNNRALEQSLDGLSPQEIMAELGYPGLHPEGRFLPDTYYFPRGTTDREFLARAFRAMDNVLAEEWEQRVVGLPFNNPYEALTLASIVEKETGLESERHAIAGVFVRRLEKGMRLQTDPTVIYGLGDKYDGNIRRRDLNRDTPYNTYRRAGLPPTPIALPGRAAINATLNPEEGDALYFVSRGDGSHKFSATLKEHNEAVIQYQLKGKRRSFSSYRMNDPQDKPR